MPQLYRGLHKKNVHRISNFQIITQESHKSNEKHNNVSITVDVDLGIQIAWDQRRLEQDPIYGTELHLVQLMYCLRYIFFQWPLLEPKL